MSTLQALETYYADIMRVGFAQIPPSTVSFLAQQAVQVDSGALSLSAAEGEINPLANGTTSVAQLTYQVFTGATPLEGGLDYLVSPTGPDPTNLNSAYFQNFNLENRYINFAVNLGSGAGQGAAAFSAAYGPGDIYAATTQAYQAIFGVAPTTDKVHQLIDAQVTTGGQTITRGQYFADYGGDGLNGIATKAAMVGWLLAEAEKADQGPYAKAEDAFLTDLGPDGFANFHTNLLTTYGPQPPGAPGATITFNHDQSVSPTATDASLRSTDNNDTISGTSGLDQGQSILTGGGNDSVSAQGGVAGLIQTGNGDDTITVDNLATSATGAGAIVTGSGNDTITIQGSMAAGTSVTGGGGHDVLNLPGESQSTFLAAGGAQISGIQDLYMGFGTVDVSAARGLLDVWGTGTGAVTVANAPAGFIVGEFNTTGWDQLGVGYAPGTTNAEVHLVNTNQSTSLLGVPGGVVVSGVPGVLTVHVDSNSVEGVIGDRDGSTIRVVGAGTLTSLFQFNQHIGAGPAFLDLSQAAAVTASPDAPNDFTADMTNGGDTLDFGFTNPNHYLFELAKGGGAINVGSVGGGGGTLDLSNLAVAGTTIEDLAAITGFTKGSDHLNLTMGLSTLATGVQAFADGAPTLFAALTNVSAHMTAEQVAIFEYGGDTYVYKQDATPGVHTGDGLVDLVGVTGLSVASGSSSGDIHLG